MGCEGPWEYQTRDRRALNSRRRLFISYRSVAAALLQLLKYGWMQLLHVEAICITLTFLEVTIVSMWSTKKGPGE
jgi:hypothetical protein